MDDAQCAVGDGKCGAQKGNKKGFLRRGGGGGARCLVNGMKGTDFFLLLHKVISGTHPNMVIDSTLIPSTTSSLPLTQLARPDASKRQVIIFPHSLSH